MLFISRHALRVGGLLESLNRSAKDFGVDFKTLFEASPGLYLVLLPNDPHFTIVAVSDNYLSTTLTKREDIVGRDLFEVFPDNPNDQGANGVANLKASFGKVIKYKTPDVMSKQKYDIPNPDGTGFEERHWRVCNSPVCNSEKDVKYIIHSVMDVTGFLRSKNEVKLQKGKSSREKSTLEFEIFSRELLLEDINQYLQSILDTADHAFVSVDLKGEITSWNKHAEEIFGWTKNEVLGRSLVSTIVPPRFQQAHNQGFQRFIETNESKILGQRLELSALHKKGHEIPVELTVNVLKHRDSLSFFAFLQDITDRKEAEKRIHLLNMRLETKVKERTSELQKALSLADDANRIKSVFLANMSHEIRTPLGAVLGYAELLANPEVNSYERQNFISAIKRNGELLSNIINDILDLSKVEAGKLEIEMGDVLVSELLTDLASLLNLKALSKGIRLSVSCEGTIPKSIRTDALRLRQVLLNIVGNAIKFTERGMVQVLLKMDEKNKLVFEVRDTGCGLSTEHAKKYFNPFTRQIRPRSARWEGLVLVLFFRNIWLSCWAAMFF